MNHHIFLNSNTPLAHEAGRKWLQVFAIYFERKVYFGVQNQKCALGAICYFDKENKVRPLRKGDVEDYYMIVAFPDEIGWVFNQGPPHDHNYDYNKGHFVELLHPQTMTDIISSKVLIHIEVELYYETGLESPLPYSPVYKDDKVIMNLKSFKDFLDKEPLVDMSSEAIEKRKDALSKVEKLAEEMWDNMDHEGDENEKRYWIRGFISGFSIGKD